MSENSVWSEIRKKKLQLKLRQGFIDRRGNSHVTAAQKQAQR